MFKQMNKSGKIIIGKTKGNFALLVIISLAFLFITLPVLAKESAVDIALVLDTSGSMKKNDPKRLRVEAAKMFVSLLDREDRVSVLSFSNRAYPMTDLLTLDKKKNEDKLMQSIDKMVANGKYTNLHDALLQGYKILKKNNKDQNREKHIVLMSDGQMDLGNKERNLKLLEKTLDDLTPKLAADNIKVHTIAFTKDSYIPLLKLTAEDTGGQFVLLKDADSVHQVFENIFVRTKEPEEIPLKEDNFIVDEDIKELTIVASKYKPGSVISLESPDGNEISKAQHDNNVKWFTAEKFDLITVKQPTPGYWLIKFSEGGNKAYILSDLTLMAESTKKTANPGTPLHIRAYLSKKGKVVKSKALLKASSFKIKVTSPAGEVINNKLIDDGTEIGSEGQDGIYGISYAFDNPGAYKIEIEVNSETFDRKKTLFVDVISDKPAQPFASPPVEKAPAVAAPEPEKVAEAVVEDPHAPAHAAEQQHDAAASHNAAKDAHSTATDHQTDTSHEGAQSHADAQAANEHGDAESMHAAEGGYSLKEAIIFFVMFNMLLAAGGGGYYYYYRRQKQQKDKEAEPAETIKNAEVFDENAVDLAADEFAEMDDDHAAPDLESSEAVSNQTPANADEGLSDIDLEEELSSILDNEETKKE